MQIILFGIAREIVGSSKILVPENVLVTTVSQLKTWMKQQYPQLAALTSVAVAVNSRYAEDNELLEAGSEIAFIPPVSGG